MVEVVRDRNGTVISSQYVGFTKEFLTRHGGVVPTGPAPSREETIQFGKNSDGSPNVVRRVSGTTLAL